MTHLQYPELWQDDDSFGRGGKSRLHSYIVLVFLLLLGTGCWSADELIRILLDSETGHFFYVILVDLAARLTFASDSIALTRLIH